MTDPQLICPRCGKDNYLSRCSNCGSDSLRYKDGRFECSNCGIDFPHKFCKYCDTTIIIKKMF
jgi:predicted RNA-binding Zn-ribbon protein involved in translation (DUF1610 family)